MRWCRLSHPVRKEPKENTVRVSKMEVVTFTGWTNLCAAKGVSLPLNLILHERRRRHGNSEESTAIKLLCNVFEDEIIGIWKSMY